MLMMTDQTPSPIPHNQTGTHESPNKYTEQAHQPLLSEDNNQADQRLRMSLATAPANDNITETSPQTSGNINQMSPYTSPDFQQNISNNYRKQSNSNSTSTSHPSIHIRPNATNINTNNPIFSETEFEDCKREFEEWRMSLKSNIFGLSHYRLCWIAFFILGLFNNFTSVVIVASAKSLADKFNQSNLIGVEAWALTIMAFIMKFANAILFAYFEKVLTHSIRLYFSIGMYLVGMCLLAISVSTIKIFTFMESFEFVIIAFIVIGGQASFSENVIIGFLKLSLFDSFPNFLMYFFSFDIIVLLVLFCFATGKIQKILEFLVNF